MSKSASIHSGRTRFAQGIVAEFWAPKKATSRAVIIYDGCPSVPSKKRLAEFFARKGYWVFHPRYRGSWESTGEFLKESPADDLGLLIDSIPKGFKDSFTGVKYYLDIREYIVVGASFGGAAAILASRNPRVVKAIAIAPVVDWKAETNEELFEFFVREITDGFPGAYRCPKKNFRKLLRRKFYNPIDWTYTLKGEKLFLVHAKDDPSVPYLPTKKLAQKIGTTYIERSRGGHLKSLTIIERTMWKKVNAFLKKQQKRVGWADNSFKGMTL